MYINPYQFLPVWAWEPNPKPRVRVRVRVTPVLFEAAISRPNEVGACREWYGRLRPSIARRLSPLATLWHVAFARAKR